MARINCTDTRSIQCVFISNKPPCFATLYNPGDADRCWNKCGQMAAKLVHPFEGPWLFVCALMSLLPVLDVLTDLLAAGNFALDGHPWWCTISVVIFYLSSRFTVLFLAIHPQPKLYNVFCLYVPIPGLWVATGTTRASRASDGAAGAGEGSQNGPAHQREIRTGLGSSENGTNVNQVADVDEALRKALVNNCFTTYLGNILKVSHQPH